MWTLATLSIFIWLPRILSAFLNYKTVVKVQSPKLKIMLEKMAPLDCNGIKIHMSGEEVLLFSRRMKTLSVYYKRLFL